LACYKVLGSEITLLRRRKMSEIKFVGKGTKVYIVYDEKGVEVANFYIRSTGQNQAEKTAQAMFGKKASVAYTEV